MADVNADDVILENLCPRCDGKGRWQSYDVPVSCSECGGAGHVPTALGEAFLDLVRHNWHLLSRGE